MKFTQYFLHTRNREDRKRITDDWILLAMTEPARTERQADGRVRYWAWIESEQKYLRVIVLEDGATVHNAFFDRSFKEKLYED